MKRVLLFLGLAILILAAVLIARTLTVTSMQIATDSTSGSASMPTSRRSGFFEPF
jgi:hypothetical protein